MSLLAEALQPSLVSGIFGVSGRLDPMSLTDVITAKRAAYALGFDVTGKCLNLDFRDSSFVVSATASDCSRLSVSSLQTASLLASDFEEKLSLPWYLVHLYYSAFYSAHAVVRMLGQGCCWLDHAHVSHVDAIAKATGVTHAKLEPGAYKCSIEAGATRLSWSKLSGSSRGGAHEGLWSIFHDHLRVVSDEILRGPLPTKDSQAAFAQIELFLQLAKRNQSPIWLSRTRNEIQYRLSHQVWHPAAIHKKDRINLRKIGSQWEADPMAIDFGIASSYGLLGEFSTACAFTISLCRALLIRINDRNVNRAKSFVHFGPMDYLNKSRLQT